MELISPRLSFTRDGHRLVAVDRDAVAVIDTRTNVVQRIVVDAPRAAIGFVDQIWVAHGRDARLSRFGLLGGPLGDDVTLVDGEGMLVAAAVGAPAALWTPGTVVRDEHGAVCVDAAPTGDLAIPLTARRWIVANGSRVAAPSGLSCELAPGSRVVAGAIVLDHTAVALVVERPGARELIVVGLSNARMQMRVPVAAGLARVATRRGLLGVLLERKQIGLVDLRSGRLTGEMSFPFDVEDFALDPDGNRIALRDGGTLVELADVRQLLEAHAAARVVEMPDEEAPAEHAASTSEPPVTIAAPCAAPPPRTSGFTRPLELRALTPIVEVSNTPRSSALALLDIEMRRIGLWTLQAISDGWDSRRIGYGNEGQHPFEHEVAALLGMNSGFALEHVEAAAAHLAAHEASCVTGPDPRASDTPIGALALELGLSPLAVDVLLVVAAPSLWSEAARLFGILANDPGRASVDEALVQLIIGRRASPHDIAAELEPRAPLIRLGVITVDDRRPRPFAGLAVDPIVLARLRRELPDLGTGLVARGSNRALEEIAIAPNLIPTALDSLARASGYARIAVRGRVGCGRRTLLAALAAEAGRALGIIDATLLPRRDWLDALRRALRRAQLAGLLPCVVGLELMAHAEHDSQDQLLDATRSHPGPIAVVLPPNEAPPFDAGYVAIDIPILSEGARHDVWRDALGDAGLVADIATLAARYRIGPGTIRRAISAVVSSERAPDEDSTPQLDAFIRQARDNRLGAHARRVDRLASWDQLVLPGDIGDSLRELVARVKHRCTVFETWGMDRQMATSRGLTALFSGPPGTGKTLVAGVIARELGLDLYQVDLSKVMSKWIGESERNLAAIFDAAEDGQVILLFDEADSLFSKRTQVHSSNDRYANLEVNYLLQRLDSFEGIAILTTNLSTSIDPAFKRRMSFRLSFPFPDEETRVELWRAHLPSTLPIAEPLALDKLAHKYQLSGGYIRNACLRAAFLAARDATPLTQHHLERAVALEYAELGKLSAGGSLD